MGYIKAMVLSPKLRLVMLRKSLSCPRRCCWHRAGLRQTGPGTFSESVCYRQPDADNIQHELGTIVSVFSYIQRSLSRSLS